MLTTHKRRDSSQRNGCVPWATKKAALRVNPDSFTAQNLYADFIVDY